MTIGVTPEGTRRDGIPAHPIVLADGRAWGFALPSARLRPVLLRTVRTGEAEGAIEVRATVEYPLEVRRRVDAMRSAIEDGSIASRWETFFDLAAALLRRAHDVGPATVAGLLDLGDDLPRFAAEVIAVAFGAPPAADAHPAEGVPHV